MKEKFLNMGIKFDKILAAMAMMFTIANINSACLFITNQPKMPEEAKKLRKF